MKLLPLYRLTERHYQVANFFVEEYCTQADAPEASKTGQYHFGYGSLKWALMSINDLDPTIIKDLFRNILFEHIARQFPITKLEHNILQYAMLYPWKDRIRQRETINVNTLVTGAIGPCQFIINDTEQNLTAQIFRRTTADAIIFHNPATHAAGFVFRINSGANLLAGFKHYLLASVTATEEGWTAIGPDMNLIINHGAPNGTASSLSADHLTALAAAYPGFKS